MAMPTREEIEAVLDEIRPALRFDGGDVELVDVQEDGVVLVRMMGRVQAVECLCLP
jgi:Fe-S cluster biogenesis protein NfuA